MDRPTRRARTGLRATAAAAVVATCLAACTTQPTKDDLELPSPTRSGARPGQSGEDVHTVDSSTPYVYLPAPQGDPEQDYGSLYLPPGRFANGSIPVVVMIHGGGWKKKAGLSYMSGAARSLQEAGVAVWNIEYRRVGSGGGWPTTFTDVARGIDFVKTLSTTVAPQLDVDNVTILGHSAGGELAAWAGARRTLPPGAPGAGPLVMPRTTVSLSGVLDMAASAHYNNHVRNVLGGMPDQVPDRYALVNPLQRIDPSVPAVVVHGTKDRVVPSFESVEYARALSASGGHSYLLELAGANHGQTISVSSRWWPRIRSLVVAVAKLGFAAATTAAEPPRPVAPSQAGSAGLARNAAGAPPR
ncbi:alpha/beta hydrolase [Tsukamurella sp. 8F]|uniref:alpha/beta hydrolase family protein n=1 Tax=unclassified Tsukamurella TaxID=2633480 RepID=UPI0023B8BE80|nr:MULTISPECIES: alpha/beta hydrolase [unclassified Tsukamurella]MDF0530842.1 alpha/beta hydrolase [Tsukamurella sp. 8J]MDF0588213.1 alpha/beta hydrolase [Tsukamurella sp. 8F]